MNAGAFAVRVSTVRARLLAGAPSVEAERRAEIDAAWRRALAERPKMFNGRILLGVRATVEDGALVVDFREAAFATLVWLRGAGQGEARLFNVFGAAAVISRDGAALLGRMAPHTANAGQVYFPCGTPDRGDVRGETVDIEGSIMRELAEETGLTAPFVRATNRSVAVFDGPLVGLIRRFETDLAADEIASRAARHLAAEHEPELDRIVMARSADELDDASPAYVKAALAALAGA